MLFILFVDAQVGIGTSTHTSDLEVKTNSNTSISEGFKVTNSSGTTLLKITDDGTTEFPSTKPVIMPRNSNVSTVTSLVAGMMIYDTSAVCTKEYNGTAWTCIG